MRLFNISNNGKFEEFSQIPFHADHEERILEDWMESNPNGVLEDGNLLIIGRQISTNLGGFIDLLGIDRDGDVVIIELKRDRTPRDTLAQALEYASFAEQLNIGQLESILQKYQNDDSITLSDYHRNYFELSSEEAVAFNKDQRIVIVGQRISDEIKQTSLFLRAKGIRVTCLEFFFFQTDDGKNLLSHDVIVGNEPKNIKQITTGSLPIINKDIFLKTIDDNGKTLFKRILDYANERSLPIHWGTKGFSMNFDKNGIHVPICYGYPPSSVYKQSIYLSFVGKGGLKYKLNIDESIINQLYEHCNKTGLFQSAGREMKAVINEPYSENKIKTLINIFNQIIQIIKNHELK